MIVTETRAYLAERGVNLGGTQQTKTRAALDFFTNQLKSELRGEEAG